MRWAWLLSAAFVACTPSASDELGAAGSAPAVPDGSARSAPKAVDETTLALCTNGIDDGTDGDRDCADSDCLAFCTDNDNDGFCEVGEDDNNNGTCANGEIDAGSRDCDDALGTVSPDDPENTLALCTNSRDDDCDGNADAAESSCASFYDADGDGFCPATSCAPGLTPGDCAPNLATQFPGAPENTLALCSNNDDDDCDSDEDEDDATCEGFYDQDGDNYCAAATCTGGDTPGDCDETRDFVNPGATENTVARCLDGRDNDCDGTTDLLDSGCQLATIDKDADTYCANGQRAPASQVCAGATSPANIDCDDTRADVSPGDPENTLATCTNGRDDDCDGDDDEDEAACATFYDGDSDGYCEAVSCAPGLIGGDCAPANAAVSPGATDVVANGVDEDCDLRDSCYEDLDNDNHGSTTVRDGLTLNCSADAGNAPTSADCDDALATRFPGNPEICDTVDNNCDGTVDEGVGSAFFRDADGDGYGDPTDSAAGCTAPLGYVGNDDDCDDTDPGRNPGATDVVADGFDQDCDGVDSCYRDVDGDSFGSTTVIDGPAGGCAGGAGVSVASTDCDDTSAARFPGNPEICDQIDNDCAGGVDNGLTFTGYKPDTDSDGFGSIAAAAVSTCDGPPAGHVLDATDCDDTSAARFPGNPEICDQIDNNCAGGVDDGLVFIAYRIDNDDDGFGSAITADVSTCDGPPTDHVANATDCDDTSALRFPGNPEVCDQIDNNCAGGVDDGLGFVNYYVDVDADGFGALGSPATTTCSGAPPGSVTDATDCNDTAVGVNPGASEQIANGVDEDCDGSDDCWLDLDGDGVGQATSTPGDDLACDGAGESDRSDDCDDADPIELPGQSWFADCDGDGSHRALLVTACAREDADLLTACGAPAGGYVVIAPPTPDCDDADSEEFPGQVWYADCDDDGVSREPAVVGCALADAVAASPCDAGAPDGGWDHDAPAEADCDDETDARFPGNPEACEAIGQPQVDNDCDDDVNGVGPGGGPPTNAAIFYQDFDLDGFGEPGPGVLACEQRPGIATNDADCDDLDPTIFVGAPEVCDGRDQNCNSLIDEADFLAPADSFCIELYRDRDGDGYGDQGATQCLCVDNDDLVAVYDNENYVATYTDCDDLHAELRPHECNDASDNDDDGLVDANDPDCARVMDGGVLKQPTVEGPGGGSFKVEVLDGHDNDCDGYVPLVELDCDDDGSLPALPILPGGGFFHAAELGLTACSGSPIQQSCWGQTLTLECDALTGLWATRWAASEDGFGGRYSNAYRNLVSVGCDPTGDCDDQCPDRCPGSVERCDGVDNDCTGVPEAGQIAGIPDALGAAVVVGTVSASEQDRDGDGYTACVDDFRANSPQFQPTLAACTPTVIEGFDSDCSDLCSLQNAQATEWCNGFVDVCGAALAEGEGPDADRDGHLTCGANGAVDTELDEQLVVAVWSACAPGRDGCDGVTAAPPAGTEAWVPLLLPRDLAPDCDARLGEQLDGLLAAVDADPSSALSEDAELTVVCDPRTGGVCTALTLLFDPDADLSGDAMAADALEDGNTSLACVDAREQYLSRAVWSADRIAASRRAVVDAECRRLYGVPCASIGAEQPIVGIASPPDIDDLLEGPNLWWQEIGRFFPRSIDGAAMTCWGDPRNGLSTLEDAVGGDCADGLDLVNRDQPEGPDDLLGVYLGDPGDCALCTDGLDNNCDGRIDCEDPSCAVCFVGVGRGCDGGRDPCNPPKEGAGCSSAPLGGGLAVWLLVVAGVTRRLRRSR